MYTPQPYVAPSKVLADRAAAARAVFVEDARKTMLEFKYPPEFIREELARLRELPDSVYLN